MQHVSLQSVDSSLLFQGRGDDLRLGQWVKTSLEAASQAPYSFAMYGCPDDLGVRRNRGRPGAAGGPNGIRKYFYKIAVPADETFEKQIELSDVGNIPVTDNIELNHKAAFATASGLASQNRVVIPLGGGHDYVAPNFGGFAQGYRKTHGEKSRLALMNIDPHLDVRPLEDGLPHSGTGFRQLVDTGTIKGPDLVEFGAREGLARPRDVVLNPA